MSDKPVALTSKTLSDLETWIASDDGRRYSCTRQYPYPGYACDRNTKCVGCLMVAAALELRNKPHIPETSERSDAAAAQALRECMESGYGVVVEMVDALRLVKIMRRDAQKASEPHKRVWTGPGHLEETGYIDPTPENGVER